jgi:hypothetical protein
MPDTPSMRVHSNYMLFVNTVIAFQQVQCTEGPKLMRSLCAQGNLKPDSAGGQRSLCSYMNVPQMQKLYTSNPKKSVN